MSTELYSVLEIEISINGFRHLFDDFNGKKTFPTFRSVDMHKNQINDIPSFFAINFRFDGKVGKIFDQRHSIKNSISRKLIRAESRKRLLKV